MTFSSRSAGVASGASSLARATAGSADRLVMVADENYHAGKIYASLGFTQHGRLGSVCQEPAPA